MCFDHRAFLKTVGDVPGVYRMCAADGKVLYVGKARSLKKRLSGYFVDAKRLTVKTRAMRARIDHIEVTVTRNEIEALLLEQDMIKALKPPYNVLLKDDKHYPELFISTAQAFPGAYFHRGLHRRKGRYFGPYPSVGAVRETLQLVFTIFQLRQCEDSVFAHRSRPCLQYQIGRCSAPCVGLIDEQAYARSVADAVDFLDGKDNQVLSAIEARMRAAAETMDFEAAARHRDQMRAILAMREKNAVGAHVGDADVIAYAVDDGRLLAYIDLIRNGRYLGGVQHVFRGDFSDAGDCRDMRRQFLHQYYLRKNRDLPTEVIVDGVVDDKSLLMDAVFAVHGKRLTLRTSVRGGRRLLLDVARRNAAYALNRLSVSQLSFAERFAAVGDALGVIITDAVVCIDISHTRGAHTVASQVVFTENGPLTPRWRKYTMTGIAAGDDVAAIAQAVTRCFAKGNDGIDLLLIDGGEAQRNAALAALQTAGLSLPVAAIAKGKTRKAGLETIVMPDGNEASFTADDPALHALQHMRDEAHRFAIGAHRKRMRGRMGASKLEDVPGVGPVLRRRLLLQFGSAKAVIAADVATLAAVRGMNRATAQRIHDFFASD